MGLLSGLFGSADDERDARKLLALLEESLQRDGPEMTALFMASDEFARLQRRFWPPRLVGPSGPLHNELVSLVAKIKPPGSKYKS